MSALPEQRHSLAGLTLDAVLSDKRGSGPLTPATPSTRTLLDIIRDDNTTKSFYAHTDRKSWKLFRDKLRLKRAGAAWSSSIHIPSSDPPNNTTTRRSFQDMLSSNNSPGDSPPQSRPQFGRRTSTRIASSPTDSNHHDADSLDISIPSDTPPTRSFGPQISRHNSTRVTQRDADDNNNAVDPFEVARDGTRRLAVALAEERALSAREAVAAQEAAEAAAAAAVEAESPQAEVEEEEGESEAAAGGEASDEAQPVRMSLMDLLEETDREMGVEGSNYMMGEDEDEEFEEGDEDEDAEAESGGIEYNCCVCMVRHKGAAFIPCGHTFCRLCSRELWVQRGNCPLCNNFIVEILDIF